MHAALVLSAFLAMAGHGGVQTESVSGTPPLYETPGIHLCNATERTVSAAIATRYVKDPELPDSYQIHAIGWYRIVPGQCFTLADALVNLQRMGEQYYVYAHSAIGTWRGDGSNPNATFCATDGAAFDFEYVQKSPYCPKSVMEPYSALIPVPGVQSFVVLFEKDNTIETKGVAIPSPAPSP